eukprot:760748-Hanusia_phi.AAC.3
MYKEIREPPWIRRSRTSTRSDVLPVSYKAVTLGEEGRRERGREGEQVEDEEKGGHLTGQGLLVDRRALPCAGVGEDAKLQGTSSDISLEFAEGTWRLLHSAMVVQSGVAMS